VLLRYVALCSDLLFVVSPGCVALRCVVLQSAVCCVHRLCCDALRCAVVMHCICFVLMSYLVLFRCVVFSLLCCVFFLVFCLSWSLLVLTGAEKRIEVWEDYVSTSGLLNSLSSCAYTVITAVYLQNNHSTVVGHLIYCYFDSG